LSRSGLTALRSKRELAAPESFAAAVHDRDLPKLMERRGPVAEKGG